MGVLGGMRDTEVHQVGEIVLGHQDVLGFDVAVDESLPVRGIEGRGDLLDDGHRTRRREHRFATQQGTQILPLDQTHVDEQDTVDLTPVVDRDDVRFAEPRRSVRLPPESLLVDLVVCETGFQEFERHHTVFGRVVGAVDLTHAATTEQLVQAIRPEPGVDSTLGHSGSICALAENVCRSNDRALERSASQTTGVRSPRATVGPPHAALVDRCADTSSGPGRAGCAYVRPARTD